MTNKITIVIGPIRTLFAEMDSLAGMAHFVAREFGFTFTHKVANVTLEKLLFSFVC